MEEIYFKKINELRKNLKKLQKALKVKLTLSGRKLTIEGESLDEYEAVRVLDAMNFGFSAQKSLQLIESDMDFRIVHIKDFTRKKNFEEIKSRLIGSKGQTKRIIEDISGCDIIIKDYTIGILGPSESIEAAVTATSNIIKGSKQTNMYKYLVRIKKERKEEGLGLKE